MSFIKSLFSTGAKELIATTGKVLDDLIPNKVEREAAKLAVQQEINRHEEAMIKQAADLEKAYLEDVANSREANKAIQESDKASWMAKNIAYMIDIWLAFIWGVFTLYVAALWAKLISSVSVDMTGILSLYATVTTVFMITVNFHRGTSQGSSDKQKLLDKMLKR